MKRQPSILRSLIFAALVVPHARALAATVDLEAAKDNTLYENITVNLSNGAGPEMFVGRNQAGVIRRSVISFDVAESVPVGATITAATLKLHLSRTPSAVAEAVDLHRLEADWGEGGSIATGGMGGGGAGGPALDGDATWVHRFLPGSLWTSPGGDFSSVVSASQMVAGTGFYNWASTSQMISDVQNWLDMPATNFGWALLGNEVGLATSRRFDTRENLVADNRPLLTIEYEEGSAATDLDGDGDVDGRDYLLVQGNDPSLIPQWESEFGSPAAPGLTASRTVPEPASCVICVSLLACSTVLPGQRGFRRRRILAIGC